MVEIIPEFLLVVLFEMNALKVEFFDCEQYVTTIDDLVQALIDIIEKTGNDWNFYWRLTSLTDFKFKSFKEGLKNVVTDYIYILEDRGNLINKREMEEVFKSQPYEADPFTTLKVSDRFCHCKAGL